MVEFGDFECPHCASFYPHVEKLVEEMGDRLCFVYRHFPLRNVHLHSTLAALAAEAAGRQDQFLEHASSFVRKLRPLNGSLDS